MSWTVGQRFCRRVVDFSRRHVGSSSGSSSSSDEGDGVHVICPFLTRVIHRLTHTFLNRRNGMGVERQRYRTEGRLEGRIA